MAYENLSPYSNVSLFVTPESYGAIGDGVTDDTEAIQAAATAAQDRKLVFRNAKYLISSQIVFPQNVQIEGYARKTDWNTGGGLIPSPMTGFGTVILSAQLTNLSYFKLANGCSINRVNFDVTDTLLPEPGYPTGGKVIDFSGAHGVLIENMSINRAFDGIYSSNVSRLAQGFLIRNVHISNTRNSGVRLNNVVIGKCQDVVVANMENETNNQFVRNSSGFLLEGACATITVESCLSQSLNAGIRMNGGEPNGTWEVLCDDIHVTDCTFDSCYNLGVWATNVQHSTIKGCYVTGGNWSIALDGYTSHVEASGCTLTRSTKNAVWLGGNHTSQILVESNKIGWCAQAGTYNAIEVDAGTSNFIINGNTFSLTSHYGPQVGAFPYSIHVAAGASDHYNIVNNVGQGVTGMVSDEGTGVNKAVANNTP